MTKTRLKDGIVYHYEHNDKLVKIANKLCRFDKVNNAITDDSKFNEHLKKRFPNLIEWAYSKDTTNGKIGFLAIKTSLHKAKKTDKAKRKKKNKYLKEYYQKNKEKMRLTQKKYYQKNKYKLQQKQLKYYAKYRKNILEKNSIYKIKNYETIKKQKAKYYQKNKQQIAFNYKQNKQNILINPWLKQYKKEPYYKYQKYDKYR